MESDIGQIIFLITISDFNANSIEIIFDVKHNKIIYQKKQRRIKMPRRDGTGRDGKGARTGRGLGDCKPKRRVKK